MIDEGMLMQLCTIYDRGRLVPVLGSGMSRPTCVGWPQLVASLEEAANIPSTHEAAEPSSAELIRRADKAMQHLRLGGGDLATHVRDSVYVDEAADVPPPQMVPFAKLFWPLVCTTNYDDIYLQLRIETWVKRWKEGKTPPELPLVLGRNARDCRRLLQHVRFPMREVVWALQGFLRPRSRMLAEVEKVSMQDLVPSISGLESEIVVGHREYRRVANREPHFRRCFADVFRRSSMFFLGSGLAEPYFLTLFDEIIELTGPPENPHFAIVQAGDVDPDFMRRRYHIECVTYERGQHNCVEEALKGFGKKVRGERVRQTLWGCGIKSRDWVCRGERDDFVVSRDFLPDPDELPCKEAVAISCGRSDDSQVKVGNEMSKKYGLDGGVTTQLWLDKGKTVARFDRLNRRCVYGIAARETKDRRTPVVVGSAFKRALDELNRCGYETVHVQLLAAGPNREFLPWISLVQMARAYGAWHRCSADNRLVVRVHVVDPSVIAILRGGYLDLAEHLEDTPLYVGVEIESADGVFEWHGQYVDPMTTVGGLLAGLPSCDEWPLLEVYPPWSGPARGCKPALATVENETVENFGLVSGSTLIVEYPARGPR